MAKKNEKNDVISLKEKIGKKRAMLEVVDEISSSINGSVRWTKQSLEQTEQTLAEMRDNWDSEGGSIDDDWSYKASLEQCEKYRQSLMAYSEVMSVLEALI